MFIFLVCSSHLAFQVLTVSFVFSLNYPGPSTGRQEVVAEYFAKCWLCSKGFPSAAVLREHLQNVHNESPSAIATAMAALQQQQSQQQIISSAGSSVQPTTSAPVTTNTSSSSTSSSSASSSSSTGLHQLHRLPHACLQCSATFAERDELERHELTHSPTAQVVIQSIRPSLIETSHQSWLDDGIRQRLNALGQTIWRVAQRPPSSIFAGRRLNPFQIFMLLRQTIS